MPEVVGPPLPDAIYYRKPRYRRRPYRHHNIPIDPRNQVIYHVGQLADKSAESTAAVADSAGEDDTAAAADRNRKGRPKGSKNRSQFNSFNDECEKRSFVYTFAGPTKCKSCERTFVGDPAAHCHEYHKTVCPICGRTYKPPLTAHIKSHGTRHVRLTVECYECYECKEKFGNADTIAAHVLNEHLQGGGGGLGAEGPSCCICGWTAGTGPDGVVDLREHVTVVHTDTPTHLLYKHLQQQNITAAVIDLECTLCGVQFDDRAAVVSHLVDKHCPRKTFSHPAVYKCRVCGAGFKSQINVLRHACNKIKSPHCDQCDKTFPSKMRYAFHLQFHNDHPKCTAMHLHCDMCLAEFDDEYQLYDHIRFRHELHDKAVCETCGRTFKSSMGLNIHRRYHVGSRNFTCKLCNKSFLNRSTLREHEISHMDVKPFQCNICGQYLSRASRLRSHVKTHRAAESTEQTCYSCDECGFVAPNQNLLAEHACKGYREGGGGVTVARLSSVVKCEYCDSTYVNAEHLNAHRNAAHDNGGGDDSAEEFVCVVCSSRFSTYSRLTTHKLTHGINMESAMMDQADDDDESPDDPQQDAAADHDRFTVPQYFACQYCSKRCLHYTYFCLHRRLKHPPGVLAYTCNQCSVDFKTSWKLSYHKKTVHGLPAEEKMPEEYECTLCSRKFFKIGALNLHKTRSHIDVGSDVCKYLCHHCGKFFSSECSLRNHNKTHDKRQIAALPIAQQQSQQPAAVNQQHNRFRTYRKSSAAITATGGKPTAVQNPCPYCPYSTDDKATFIDHVTRHIQTKSISFVATAAPASTAMTVDSATATTFRSTAPTAVVPTATAVTTATLASPKIFRCQLCDVEFDEPGRLFRAHLENHADRGEAFLCQSCYVPFMSCAALSVHRAGTALCGQRPDVRFVDAAPSPVGGGETRQDVALVRRPLIVDCTKIFKNRTPPPPPPPPVKQDAAVHRTPPAIGELDSYALDELMAIISTPRSPVALDDVNFVPSPDYLNGIFDSICTSAGDRHDVASTTPRSARTLRKTSP